MYKRLELMRTKLKLSKKDEVEEWIEDEESYTTGGYDSKFTIFN